MRIVQSAYFADQHVLALAAVLLGSAAGCFAVTGMHKTLPAPRTEATTTAAVDRPMISLPQHLDASDGKPALPAVHKQFDSDEIAETKSIDEPFAARAAASYGDISVKWFAIRKELEMEKVILAQCEHDANHCSSAGAVRFLAIAAAAQARTGLARLGEVNRAVNLTIRPMSDFAQYGVPDRWVAPLELLTRGAGDCEDYAIAKYAILRAIGYTDEDLRLVIVRDVKMQTEHAVLAVRLDGRWRVLDNRRLLMLEDRGLHEYEPLFVLGAGARRVVNYGIALAADNAIEAASPGR